MPPSIRSERHRRDLARSLYSCALALSLSAATADSATGQFFDTESIEARFVNFYSPYSFVPQPSDLMDPGRRHFSDSTITREPEVIGQQIFFSRILKTFIRSIFTLTTSLLPRSQVLLRSIS
jgi:hypothetical protein